jgi:NAD(P)-dependent dehydrogenase (short-subunit alcohol dehydrogenase family)
MKRAGWGRIVNVGSSGSIIGYKGMAAYNATKAAIRSLTVTAAREWRADGIVVNLHHPVSIAQTAPPPPGSDSESVDERLLDPYVQETIAIASALKPASFNGDPENDLGPVIRFLLSDDCRYLTGQALTLDGGSFAFS